MSGGQTPGPGPPGRFAPRKPAGDAESAGVAAGAFGLPQAVWPCQGDRPQDLAGADGGYAGYA